LSNPIDNINHSFVQRILMSR